jgi:hypothetical protein
MPDPITHLIVTTSLLWVFWDKEYRNYVLLLSPLAVFPDLDHLVPPYQRLFAQRLHPRASSAFCCARASWQRMKFYLTLH